MTVRPPTVYAIADVSTLGPSNVADAVGEMAQAGVVWIQLRAKSTPDAELFELAQACHRAVAGTEAELWMDDRADIAALLPFRGVHVGQDDLPPAAARAVVGVAKAIGRSTHNAEQVEAADQDPDVDVVAYGPVFETSGKEAPDPTVGLEGLRAARRLTAKPLVAIGGIDESSVREVLDAGADSVAMIGAVCHGNIGANCRRLLDAARGASV